MANENADNVEVELRRSGRKRRTNWKETYTFSVRASRAKPGGSKKTPVRSRGGQPTHKKKRQKTKAQVRTY
jgi:hypothetical protein